ncbi:hypothetical protein JCM39068_43650 [Desulfocastanea catecholica]
MTRNKSGHTPSGMDRLIKTLITEYSRYCTDLQWFMSFCLVDFAAILCVLALLEGLI